MAECYKKKITKYPFRDWYCVSVRKGKLKIFYILFYRTAKKNSSCVNAWFFLILEFLYYLYHIIVQLIIYALLLYVVNCLWKQLLLMYLFSQIDIARKLKVSNQYPFSDPHCSHETQCVPTHATRDHVRSVDARRSLLSTA